jgi:hypothetical protein
MYLLIGATVALFGLAAVLATPGDAVTRGTMPRSRRVQPHTRDAHDLVGQEATLARDRIYLLMARLG